MIVNKAHLSCNIVMINYLSYKDNPPWLDFSSSQGGCHKRMSFCYFSFANKLLFYFCLI